MAQCVSPEKTGVNRNNASVIAIGARVRYPSTAAMKARTATTRINDPMTGRLYWFGAKIRGNDWNTSRNPSPSRSKNARKAVTHRKTAAATPNDCA